MCLNPPYHIDSQFIDQFITTYKRDYVQHKIIYKKSQKISSMRLCKLPERFLEYANKFKLATCL